MLRPENVQIDGKTGGLDKPTGHYVKRLSGLSGLFRNDDALADKVSAEDDPVVYEVIEYRKDGSDLFFGTTTMHPGDVDGEFFMTRGHFHERRDMGEVYYTQSGQGVLLLESRDGQVELIEMRPGGCAFIPPDWAHRSINTGDDKLVFVWVCNPLAGHDYGQIKQRGMRKLVMRDDAGYRLADNAQ